jgi:hypothetical protein
MSEKLYKETFDRFDFESFKSAQEIMEKKNWEINNHIPDMDEIKSFIELFNKNHYVSIEFIPIYSSIFK